MGFPSSSPCGKSGHLSLYPHYWVYLKGPKPPFVSFSEIESPSLLVRRGSLSLLRGRKSNLVRIQQARHPSRRIRWWRSASQGTVILVS